MVSYQVGRSRWSAACAEDEAITSSVAERSLIVSAVYGTTAGGRDVTASVQGLVDAGGSPGTGTPILASNALFGDPVPGVVKHFGVSWRGMDGALHQAACLEGESVVIT